MVNMLSFYVVRGINPEYLLSLTALERQFYQKSMELWYEDLNKILKIMGGVRFG